MKKLAKALTPTNNNFDRIQKFTEKQVFACLRQKKVEHNSSAAFD